MARSTISPARRLPPTTQQTTGLGPVNPASLTGRSVKLPSLVQRGLSQRRERFSDSGLAPNVIRGLDAMQNAIEAATLIASRVFPNGLAIIRGVTLTAPGPTLVKHGLGRPWVDYLVLSAVNSAVAGPVAVAIPQTPSSLESVQIAIGNDDATCVCTVWVW